MTFHPALHPTRSVSFVMLAAFAGVALWLFVPWGGGSGSGSDGGSQAGLPASLKVDGRVQVESQDGVVTQLVVPLTVRGEEGIALDGRMRAETAMSESAAAAVPAEYSVAWLDGNGDDVLDPGEHAVMTVELPERSTVYPDNPLRLVIRTPDGGTLVIEDVLGR